MMKWSHTLIAGSILILLVNAVVLFGAAYNRSGEPESRLLLSQRELQNYRWNEIRDNSGITLSLNWRVVQAQRNNYGLGYTAGKWGAPTWLDKVKMSELGFDVVKLTGTPENGRHYGASLPKEVLLVLELDGQAYQQELQRAKDYAEQSKALQAGSPDSVEFKQRAKISGENYLREQSNNSRLFVIDAGVDLQTLRATYSDRTRYAIVHGLIRPNIAYGKDGTIGGYISELDAERINVPFKFRQLFDNVAPYEVMVAFGKRLEPWIAEVSRSPTIK